MASARSIPAAMGLPACRVDRARDIAPAIEDGIASKTANLVELILRPG
jgi:thiamine pyrophosphate-dependent acetolactate synthase large subunit-like protein